MYVGMSFNDVREVQRYRMLLVDSSTRQELPIAFLVVYYEQDRVVAISDVCCRPDGRRWTLKERWTQRLAHHSRTARPQDSSPVTACAGADDRAGKVR